MNAKTRKIALFVTGLITALLTVGIVQAATPIDLTTPGATATINGAIFEAFDDSDPTGGGQFVRFVRISSPLEVIHGYNTDYRPVQFEEDDSSVNTLARLLSEVPQYLVSGTLYREFQADITQETTSDDYLLSLDALTFYESPFNDLCGYPFDGSGGGQSGCDGNNTATLVWDLDSLEDNFVILDHRNNDAVNRRDLRVLLPDALFNQMPNCTYGGEGCTIYVTIYSRFGGDEVCPRANPINTTCPNNGDFEEWGVRSPGPLALTSQTSSDVRNENPSRLLIAAYGLLVNATLILLVLRRQQRVRL